jgi:hypothetical protein
MTAELTSSLSASLSRCPSLSAVSFHSIRFDDPTSNQLPARWTQILRSVPNVRQLSIGISNLGPLTNALRAPGCLPLLERLSLAKADSLPTALLVEWLEHPSVRQLQLVGWRVQVEPPDEQVRALLHSPRLPKLERIIDHLSQLQRQEDSRL